MSTMLARESVAARMKAQDGISFTEFSYHLLQSNVFAVLNKTMVGQATQAELHIADRRQRSMGQHRSRH